jgi:hypothetical protein
LNGVKLTDYLQGTNAQIKIIAYKKTLSGNKSNADKLEIPTSPGTTLQPINLSHGGINREIIRVESVTPNRHILKVLNPNFDPPLKQDDALKQKGLDVSAYQTGQRLKINSMSYSGDTMETASIRLDKTIP